MSLKHLVAATISLSVGSFAHAANLTFEQLITIPTAIGEVPGVDATPLGIAFGGGNLNFVARPESEPEQLHRITPDGAYVSSTIIPQTSDLDIEGLTFLPNGNLILANNDTSRRRVTEVDPITLNPITNGIDFDPNSAFQEFLGNPIAMDAVGITYHADRNTLFVASSSDQEIIEFDLDGNSLGSFFTTDINAGFLGPQGIVFDSVTGNLFIADSEFGAVYETTVDGTLINTTNVEALSGRQFPSGLALDSATRTLYVAFGETLPEDTIGVFTLTNPIPEPTSAVFSLFAVGALLLRRRRLA
ncbi:MAG: hypothetical protein AAGA58_09480 [Verrucomicrobiota bacterium]